MSGTGGRDQRHTSDCVTVSLGIMKVANIIQNILKLYTRDCLVLKIYCNAVSNGKNSLRGDCSTVITRKWLYVEVGNAFSLIRSSGFTPQHVTF